MHDAARPNLDARDLRIAIVVSRYHAEVTGSLRAAAQACFCAAGGGPESLTIVEAPGTFELTALCRALAMGETGERFDAIVALGCVITGETPHDQYIAQSVTQGLTAITVQSGVPIAFGVLTCLNMEQARARSIDAPRAGAVNKGAEAMAAAIETAQTLRFLAASEAPSRARR